MLKYFAIFGAVISLLGSGPLLAQDNTTAQGGADQPLSLSRFFGDQAAAEARLAQNRDLFWDELNAARFYRSFDFLEFRYGSAEGDMPLFTFYDVVLEPKHPEDASDEPAPPWRVELPWAHALILTEKGVLFFAKEALWQRLNEDGTAIGQVELKEIMLDLAAPEPVANGAHDAILSRFSAREIKSRLWVTPGETASYLTAENVMATLIESSVHPVELGDVSATLVDLSLQAHLDEADAEPAWKFRALMSDVFASHSMGGYAVGQTEDLDLAAGLRIEASLAEVDLAMSPRNAWPGFGRIEVKSKINDLFMVSKGDAERGSLAGEWGQSALSFEQKVTETSHDARLDGLTFRLNWGPVDALLASLGVFEMNDPGLVIAATGIETGGAGEGPSRLIDYLSVDLAFEAAKSIVRRFALVTPDVSVRFDRAASASAWQMTGAQPDGKLANLQMGDDELEALAQLLAGLQLFPSLKPN